jgi:hypothetical protein
MKPYRAVLAVVIVLATAVAWLPRATGSRTADVRPLPERFTDAEYWQLSHELSEPNGSFRSDNLLSNEIWFQHVIPDLTALTNPGGAYLGVGPEQNFTYIAALKPKIAFIVDVRRGNLYLHLMYKALFEQSADRVEFVSRLFSKPRPDDLDETATAAELFDAYSRRTSSTEFYAANIASIRRHLTSTRRLPLSDDDLAGIEYVYRAFHWYGPAIQYRSTGSRGIRGWRPHATYSDLMTATDADGQPRSYLASEQAFRVVKDLHSRNMLVPVVGNFGGPKALRAVGQYVAGHGLTVSAFYLSNVEQYLRQDGLWREFCGNAASLPLDGTSQFIRSVRNGPYGFGTSLNSELATMMAETKHCSNR